MKWKSGSDSFIFENIKGYQKCQGRWARKKPDNYTVDDTMGIRILTELKDYNTLISL